MGKFSCHCGNVTSDTIYPCEWAGDLQWQDEREAQDTAAAEVLKEFVAAIEGGDTQTWLNSYFQIDYPPVDLATAVLDIHSKERRKLGHSVYRCPECEKIYIQKEYFTNEWTCYEKRKDDTK
jgi:hypothetical protein